MAAELQIHGQGALGIAFESTLGTFVAPAKFIPFRSESLAHTETKPYRMNIRGVADRQPPGVLGPSHISGDITFEVTAKTLPYFLYIARAVPARTGMGPYIYTFTPFHGPKASTGAGAAARKTASILIARGGVGFGYAGMSVGQLSFSYEDEVLLCTASLLGLTESEQTIPTLEFDEEDKPFGPAHNALEIPADTGRTDIASATLSINDAPEVRARIDGQQAPSGIRWGEREVTISVEHDFESKDDYDNFLNNVRQEIVFKAIRDATDDQIIMKVRATIADSYAMGLSSMGDLVAASVEYHGTFDPDEYGEGDIYEIEVKTTEDVLA